MFGVRGTVILGSCPRTVENLVQLLFWFHLESQGGCPVVRSVGSCAAQLLRGTTIARHNYWQAQLLAGTTIGRHNYWQAQLLADTTIGRHNYWQAQLLAGTTIGRHNYWQAQVSGRKAQKTRRPC